MANSNNLKNCEATQFRTGEEQVKIARQGGIASGQARREQRTIQKIFADYLDREVKSNKNLKKLAQNLGVSCDKSIKELATVACLINTLEKGDIDKLIKVMELLGETVEKEDNNKDVEETLAVIKECAYADRDKP